MIIYGFTGLVIWLSYYFWQKHNKPNTQLFYIDNQSNRDIISKCPSLHSYNPTPYLNGFMHTIVASLLKPKEQHTSINEPIGNTGISVDWIDKGKKIDGNQPLLFVMPGLTGKVTDSYINTIISEAHKHDFHNICVYNYRMLSPTANFHFKPSHYNYGLDMKPMQFNDKFTTEGFSGVDSDFYYFEDDIITGKRIRIDLAADVHHTLEYLKKKYGFKRIAAIGCSYGGVQLGGYLGRFKDQALVQTGVTVGTPHSMILSSKWLTYSMDVILAFLLKSHVRKNLHLFEKKENIPDGWNLDVKRALSSWWISEFDRHYTIKCYGYRTVDAYYRHFSVAPRFKDITVPMLCISTGDDAVVHSKAICHDDMIVNGHTILCVAKTGGHIGFIEGWMANHIWFPTPAMEFLSSQIN